MLSRPDPQNGAVITLVSVQLIMEDAVRTGAVNKLTVDTLKNWLKIKKISVSKKNKAELIDLVKENI